MKPFMDALLKRGNTYGATKEDMAACRDTIDTGNKQSLKIVCIVMTVYFLVSAFIISLGGKSILPGVCFAVVTASVGIALFSLSDKIKSAYVLFYIVNQTALLFGIYFHVFSAGKSSAFYLATLVIMPLFYMDYFFRMVLFLLFNALLYAMLPMIDPALFGDLQRDVLSTLGFVFVGIIIHYLYQSIRVQDIINFKKINDRQNALEISAVFDPLSKLMRRAAFIKLFEEYVENMPGDEVMGVAILDIDHFKLINDTYGHQVGDEAIAAVSQTLIKTLGVTFVMPEDGEYFHIEPEKNYGNIVSRLGGDEFIFIIRESDEAEIKNRVSHVLEAIESLEVGPLQGVKGSAGLTVIKNKIAYDTCYTQADLALYAAKTNGRNQFVVYSENLQREDENPKEEIYDELTGVFVAEAFKERAAAVLKEAAEGTFAIINVDIENFKSFNSAYGFEQGDILLKTVAKTLSVEFSGGLISRFADDHFVGLVPSANLDAILSLVRFSLEEANEEYKKILRVGIYKLKDKFENINIACDHAKFACDMLRGRYDIQTQYYDEGLQRKRDEHQYIVEHLDEAIEKNWIKVYYQPIIRTYTGKVASVEALARWDDPEGGILSPAVFVEALERTRLIYKLDLYMLEQVCINQKRDEERGLTTVPVSINISRVDFDVIDVVPAIEDILKRYNMDKNKIHIEITESAASEQEDVLKNVVKQFQSLNYEIWMDDFGAGYSSLNVLKDYNFNVIKFDLAFMRDSGMKSRVVLTSIVDMAKKLGLQTLAEGVETEEQLEFLKSIGCEYVQGFYFGKPLPYGGTRKAMVDNGIEYENLEEREFYNIVGSKNVLAPIMETSTEKANLDGNYKAIAILEIGGKDSRFLMATKPFIRLVRDQEGFTVRDIEALLNDKNNRDAKQFIDMIECIKNGDSLEKRIIIYRGVKYLISVSRLVKSESLDKIAIVVSFSDISEIG